MNPETSKPGYDYIWSPSIEDIDTRLCKGWKLVLDDHGDFITTSVNNLEYTLMNRPSHMGDKEKIKYREMLKIVIKGVKNRDKK